MSQAKRQRQTRTGRSAFHGGDDGFGAVAHRADQVVQAFQPFAPLAHWQLAPLDELAQIAPGAEVPALARQHHRTHRGVGLRLAARL
jgi:hypothetical protein